jgi:single-strand DNA-binding protein
MVNKAILIGNLGNKPESRQVGDNLVCQFSLATSETYKDKTGEKKTETTWHNLVVWGKLAEICEKYLDKGSKIYVEGKIRNREYENNEGKKVKVSEIIVNTMQMLGSKPVDSGEPKLAQPHSKTQQDSFSGPAADDDDSSNDLPF